MNKNTSIAIIGSGPAGMSAAYYLVQNGYKNVFLFEKESHTGGKCHTFSYEGNAYDMGAVEITKDYSCVLDLTTHFSLPLEKMPYSMLMDRATGEVLPLQTLINTDGNIFSMGLESLKYYGYDLSKYQSFISQAGFKNVPPDLAQPALSWIKQNNIEQLGNIFMIPVTCYGYGDLSEIPAMYLLKYIDKKNFEALAIQGIDEFLKISTEWPKRIKAGFQSLLSCMGKTLPNAPILSAKIQSITRRNEPGKEIEICYKEGLDKQSKSLFFNRLIVAIPEFSENLSFLDISEDEKNIFDQVIHNRYVTMACSMQDGGKKLTAGYAQIIKNKKISSPEINFPYAFLKPWENSNMYIFYIVADKNITLDQLWLNLKAQMLQHGYPVQDTDMPYYVKEWNYFPHVSSESISSGFYDKLELLQGKNNTYYAGGLMNFELVENSFAYSKDLVNRMISG